MIRWERNGAIAVARLDRPDRRNALTAAGCVELTTAFHDAADVRVVIVTGGPECFCAGADLRQRFTDAETGDRFRPAFDALTQVMAEVPAVIVAAVDGPALGAGTQLAAWCDLRIAGDSATFAIPAGRLGVHLAGASIARLVDVVGLSATEDLLLTSETIDADAAFRIGLVQRRAPDALEAALGLAAELAALAPLTLAGHKAALRALSSASLLSPDAARAIARSEEEAFASADFREGLQARNEKRPPRFTGA